MPSALFWFLLSVGAFSIAVALMGLWLRRRQLARGQRFPTIPVWPLSVMGIASGASLWSLAGMMASGPGTAQIFGLLAIVANLFVMCSAIIFVEQFSHRGRDNRDSAR